MWTGVEDETASLILHDMVAVMALYSTAAGDILALLWVSRREKLEISFQMEYTGNRIKKSKLV